MIGHVGRLCYQKNQDYLLDVLAQVLERKANTWLLLVGEGEDKPRLIERADCLGISSKVMFYGTTRNVERLLWAMDAFAFPSLFEGFGIATVEAQAAGLPVICSEHIPQEAYVTKQIHSVPLSRGAAAWADALLATAERYPDGADTVRNAGFDIDFVAQEIEASYLESNAFERI